MKEGPAQGRAEPEMTDPIASPAVSVVAHPAPAAATRNAEPSSPPSKAPGRTEPTRQPLEVDVARGDDGVFVYTLRDPATDTVLVVIPREDVRLDRDGRHLDQRV